MKAYYLTTWAPSGCDYEIWQLPKEVIKKIALAWLENIKRAFPGKYSNHIKYEEGKDGPDIFVEYDETKEDELAEFAAMVSNNLPPKWDSIGEASIRDICKTYKVPLAFFELSFQKAAKP